MTTQTLTSPTDPALLDVRDVAALLRCSPRHVRRLADAGRMPAPVKLGALLRFRRDMITSWLADGCKPVRTVTTKGGGR